MENVWNSNYKSKQGNVGLGAAIAYYTSIGVPISIPLNDTQSYDLVIDKNNKLQRVSIKTTRGTNKSGTHYIVQLRNTGGSSGVSRIRLFDNTSCDILFVLTQCGTMYEIPSDKIEVTGALTLNENWNKYIRTVNYGTSAQEETLDVEEG